MNDQVVGVVPVLIGPMQALIAILPGLLVALGGALVAMFKPSALKKFFLLLWSQKIAVTLILAVLVGLFIFVPKLLPAKPVTKAKTGSDWLLWRGGAERRGVLLDAEDPAHGGVNWTFVDGKINTFYASAAVIGNRVYTTSARFEYFTDKGAIYSIDTESGELVWKFNTGKYRATFSSPAVQGNILVVGEGLHFTEDSRIFCIDIKQSEAKKKGVKVWSYRTKSHVESSPCISGDRVVIGAGEDGLYCFALKPDDKGNANVLWQLKGEKYPDCEASPVVHEGKVYFCLGNNGQAVCCADLKEGKELWRVETPYPVFGSPTITDGKLFVGMGTGNYVQTAEEVATQVEIKITKQMLKEGKSKAEIAAAVTAAKKPLAPFGEVWCIDLATHKVLWKYSVKRTILGAIAAADGRLYFGSRDGHLYCISMQKGEFISKWNARSPLVTSPAVGEKHVYIVTTTGELYGLDRKTMEPVWEIDLNSESMSSPTVAGGRVYVGTTTGGFLSAGQAGSIKQKPLWASALGGPGKSGISEDSQIAARGRFSWRFPKKDAQKQPFVITTPTAALGNAFYLGVGGEQKGLTKLELTDKPAKPLAVKWLCPSDNPVYLSAAATEDAVYFVDGRKGDTGRKLRRLNPGTGEVLWSHDVATDASGEFLLTRHSGVLIADRADGLRRVLRDGSRYSEGWSQPIGTVIGTPLVIGDIAVVAIENKPTLVALDLRSGKTLWSTALTGSPRTGPVFAGDKLWVGSNSGLAAYDLVTGKELHKEELRAAKCGPVTVPLVCNDKLVAVLNETGEIVLISSETAEETGRIAGADKNKPPVLAEDALLYYDATGIKYCKLGQRRLSSKTWLNLEIFNAKVTSPAIIVKSHVYFATDTLGFVCVKPRK